MFFCDKKGAFVLFPNKVFLHVAKQIQSEYLYIRVLFVLYILKQLRDQYRFLWTAIRGLFFWIRFIWTLRVLSAPPSPHQALNRKQKPQKIMMRKVESERTFTFTNKSKSFSPSFPLLLCSSTPLSPSLLRPRPPLSGCVPWPTPEEQEHLLTGLRRL